MRLLVVGDQPGHARVQSVPAEVFLILGLPRADHADAQPPTITRQRHSRRTTSGPVPAFPDALVGKLHLAWGTYCGFTYPDKSPEHAQAMFSPCKPQAIGLISRRSKQGERLNVPSRHISDHHHL